LFLSFPLLAQEETRTLTVRHIEDEINIDGILDEAVWETAGVADDFWQFFPTDSVRAKLPKEVKMLYDDHTIYVGITAETTGEVVVANLRRDFGGATNDNVSLMFDTYSDGSNAFLFGVTPYGVQRDVLVSGGGETYNTAWYLKWQAESKMYDDHYVVELAIPLTSIKFKEGEDTWKFRPYRWGIQANEQSTWIRVPQNQLFSNMAFMGDLVFEDPLGKSRTPFAVMPYINALADKDYEFLPKEGETLASRPLIEILREGRQPGVSLLLATQQPGKIHTDVMTQSDTVISHRLTAKMDVEALGLLMQSYMRKGLAAELDVLPRVKGAGIIFDDQNEKMYPMRVRPRFTWHGGESPSAIREIKRKFEL